MNTFLDPTYPNVCFFKGGYFEFDFDPINGSPLRRVEALSVIEGGLTQSIYKLRLLKFIVFSFKNSSECIYSTTNKSALLVSNIRH